MTTGNSVLIAALAGWSCLAQATIYKCAAERGGALYQDTPCAAGRELRNFDADPANVSVVPFAVPPAAAGPAPPRAGSARSGSGTRQPAGGAVPRVAARPSRGARTGMGDARQRRFLRPGMSEGEVVARVGPPDMKTSGGKRRTRWTYMPAVDDAHTITTLLLENGAVADIERRVIQ